MAINRADIQGLVLQGYGYPVTRLLLLSFPDEASGKAFLGWVRPLITTGVEWPKDTKPEPLWNLGLTLRGLKAINLMAKLKPGQVLDPHPFKNPFPDEFVSPPDPSRLKDFKENGPEHWWDGQGDAAIHPRLHALLVISARTEAAMDDAVARTRAKGRELGVVEVIRADRPPLGGAGLADRKVHFGYVDGIGQPDVDWDSESPAPRKVDRRHFLLGDPTADVPSSPRPTATGDLFLNASYLAFRWLAQDVPAFEAFLDDNAGEVAKEFPGANARELLAAKLIGRWRDGTPLVLSPDKPDPALAGRNDFRYMKDDPDGLRCPFSAHVRVTNPRDQPLAPEVKDSGGVPPLIRRGASYGPEWVKGVNDDEERGLLGLFLCASLSRQFETINQWMNSNDFSPIFGRYQPPIRHDPLFGTRVNDPDPSFPISLASGRKLECPLSRTFVRTKGTAYFLIPTLSTLARLIEA